MIEKYKRVAKRYHSQMTDFTKEYLSNRGITEKSMKRYCIGEALNYHSEQQEEITDFNKKMKPLFWERVTFPLINAKKEVVGFSARALRKDETIKYLNSKSSNLFNKSEFLYGEHMPIKEGDKCILVEGQIDNILINQLGGYYPLNALGSSISLAQMRRIKEMGFKEVYIMGDDDKAGKMFNYKVGKLALEVGLYPIIIKQVEKYNDWGEVVALQKNLWTLEEQKQILDECERVDYFKYILDPFEKMSPHKAQSYYDDYIKGIDFSVADIQQMKKYKTILSLKKQSVVRKYVKFAKNLFDGAELTITPLEEVALRKIDLIDKIYRDKDFIICNDTTKELYLHKNKDLSPQEGKIFLWLLNLV